MGVALTTPDNLLVYWLDIRNLQRYRATVLIHKAQLPTIALVDHTGKFTQAELHKTASALTVQAQRDFAMPPPFGYGVGATVRVVPHGKLPVAGEWVLGIFAQPDQPDALGYHDETPDGLPVLKIFPFLDPTQPWSITASHEICEALADPNLCKVAQNPLTGRLWAYEVGDAVENDAYEIDNVMVSNFVLPPYFEPPTNWQHMKLDFMGLVKTPGEIRPGGYGQYWDGAGWKSIEHAAISRSKSRLALRAAGMGRHLRRMLRHPSVTPVSFPPTC